MELSLQNHWLSAARVCPSSNYDERPDGCRPELIVIHNISLPPCEYGGPWIDQLFTNCLVAEEHPYFADICHLRVASHLLIRRDGEVVQYVAFNKRAFHAGVSVYQRREHCNDFSIGIELEGSDFEAFTELQYQQLEQIIPALIAAYPSLSFEHITGHEHIAPGRKTDPGPYFDWQRLSQCWDVDLPAPAI